MARCTDVFETKNNAEIVRDELHKHNMIWKEQNGFGYLIHPKTSKSLTVLIDRSMTIAHKYYLIQRLLSKMNHSPLINV